MKKKKRHPITLIEIMIVIVLIGLISGALAFNMRGSLDKGKEFVTEQRFQRVKDILAMKEAEGESLATIQKGWEEIVKNSSLSDGEKTTKDGWGRKFIVTVDNDTLVVQADAATEKKMPHLYSH